MRFRYLLLCALLAGCASRPSPPASQNPSPMVDNTRAHERVEERQHPGLQATLDGLLARPVAVFLPQHHQAADSVRLLIHFHGAAYLPRQAVAAAAEPYGLAVVNLGSGSSVYERPFLDATMLPRLLSEIETALRQQSTQAPAFSHIVLSAFSAGYGAVRAILRHEQTAALIDGVILLDGLHTDYVPARTVLAQGGALETTKLAPFLAFAQRAVQGQARFLITHSEIFPGTYASTTETADYLLERLELRRMPVLHWGPGGMQQLSQVQAGRFTVLGFAGNTAPDHIDHLHALPAFLEESTR